MAFRPADRSTAPLRLAIVGPSGSGKTWTSLAIASGLGGAIGLIDSENSADLYGHLFKFDVDVLDQYSPAHYAKHIQIAARHGYDVLVVDGLSAAWNGKGGALEIKDTHASKMGGNDWAGWAAVSGPQNKMLEAIKAYPGHIICTMRTKTHYEIQVDPRNGKKKPVPIGTKPVQRDGIEHEFSLVFEMDMNHGLSVRKTRFPELDGLEIDRPNDVFAKQLLEALEAPAEPAPPRPVHDANRSRASKRLHAVAAEVAERVGYKDRESFQAQVRELARVRAGVPVDGSDNWHEVPADKLDALASWLGAVETKQAYQDMYSRVVGDKAA